MFLAFEESSWHENMDKDTEKVSKDLETLSEIKPICELEHGKCS